jgi:L-ascorbate metabolism protein UlaG (beta-lactamase superfamily)
MKVTKYGHCCLLIEVRGVRFLTDPGSFSNIPPDLHDISAVLITHEHADHLHTASLKHVLERNPHAEVITNGAVADLLRAERITCTVHEHNMIDHKGVSVAAYGELHAQVHASVPQVQNTGYMLDERLFYPGDAFTVPDQPCEILALPTAGPWMKLSEAIAYAERTHPKVAFPVHDGIYAQPNMMNQLIARLLKAAGIEFMQLEVGKEVEIQV